MPITAAEIAEARRLAALPTNGDDVGLAELQSVEEVVISAINYVRAAGEDEVELIEVLVRAIDLSPDDVRRVEQILRPLGYTALSDMLRNIAGSRKHSLVPLPL
jgi:hypothetical protein